MNGFIDQLKALSSANEFLEFFGITYDQHVVNVNRLHILKRFFQYLQRAEGLAGLNEIDMFKRYRELLLQAYGDFTVSTAAKEKVFKVFQDVDGQSHVSMAGLKNSLADRRKPAGVTHAMRAA